MTKEQLFKANKIIDKIESAQMLIATLCEYLTNENYSAFVFVSDGEGEYGDETEVTKEEAELFLKALEISREQLLKEFEGI